MVDDDVDAATVRRGQHPVGPAGIARLDNLNLPVVSHLIPEIHVHLIAAIPNGLTVEYMPWTLRLYEETPKIEAGQFVVPDKPGLGLAFDQAAIKRYQVG